MSHPQIKKFEYNEEGLAELNKTLSEVKFLEGQVPLYLKDNGIFVVYADGIVEDDGTFKASDHIKIIKSELVKVQAQLVGSLVDKEVLTKRLELYLAMPDSETKKRNVGQTETEIKMTDDTILQRRFEALSYEAVLAKFEANPEEAIKKMVEEVSQNA